MLIAVVGLDGLMAVVFLSYLLMRSAQSTVEDVKTTTKIFKDSRSIEARREHFGKTARDLLVRSLDGVSNHMLK
jgi:hypothetical protein